MTTLLTDLDLSSTDFDIGPGICVEPNPRQRAILLRALDHLRNLGDRGELLTLRDRLIDSGDAPWISYTLAFADDRQRESFTSYSLSYEVGERLVASRDCEYRVIGLDGNNEHKLLVEPWRPGA